ncbi:helix-turn-helix transcriptional regulator [Streptomyces sp. OF3]|uniref:Helix-turn-helix transcriptional regulator n=1 Tax=Streptomyces alkaliterrae TaxID=2213162 RepID=A0A7W3WLW2_9ACTN|nr:helix-turn-helix transcriptional regulator [Streptomyces alkaliterrae]MBB1254738.1 helix-turn-helix transcriptional regulator [Streptomyces alkaliterrae]
MGNDSSDHGKSTAKCPYRHLGIDPVGGPVELERLTRRERQVLLLLGTGMNNRELAAELGIAERTVKAHTARVLEKLRLPSRLEAAVASVLLHELLCEDVRCVRHLDEERPEPLVA